MKITVLNGSPKGETSVTMQYVKYIQKTFPEHDVEIVSVAQRIKRIERDETLFQEIVERIRASDGILWAFPLYILHVHAGYKRFIELIWERGVQDAFEGRYAATLSTSIHFSDDTAHNYVHAICDDLGMRYVGAFSPEMRDLLTEEGQRKLTTFAGEFFGAIGREPLTTRLYGPLAHRDFEYLPGEPQQRVDAGKKQVLIVTDVQPGQENLRGMVDRFRAAFAQPVETVNLRDLDIKGNCLGCLKCGYNNECAYAGKDDFIEFYRQKVETADILVFAGATVDRYLSSTWKTFFDRSFFNTHTPVLNDKQLVFILSGPLSQEPNLRRVLEAWTQFQHANTVGFVTDEYGDSAHIDALLQDAAARAVRLSDARYVQPQDFRGVGGLKVFRDDIWGPLRTVFQADHRAYRRLGIYDFPQRNLPIRLLNALTTLAFRVPQVRTTFAKRIRQGLIAPYQKVLGA
jgi:multimeric flavodoxin WrbA